MYSLICRHSKVSAIPNAQTDHMDLSAYKLKIPNKNLKRAEKIKEAIERSPFAKTCLLSVALLGTCMVIGDGILTPCISGIILKNLPCYPPLLLGTLTRKESFLSFSFSPNSVGNFNCMKNIPSLFLKDPKEKGVLVNTLLLQI